MTLRRGFKSWCENAARGYRRELKLDAYASLDPRRLASYVGVRIWEPHQVPKLAASTLKQLTVTDPQNWSAVTLQAHGKKLIIINGSHGIERQNNTIAHELSHLILEHVPARAFFSAEGHMILNQYNPVHEAEADYLAGTLLVPREALLKVLENGKTLDRAASYFGVSKVLLRMRYNMTGISRQLAYRSVKTRAS